jgi:hypothetical protein
MLYNLCIAQIQSLVVNFPIGYVIRLLSVYTEYNHPATFHYKLYYILFILPMKQRLRSFGTIPKRGTNVGIG